MAEEVKTVLGVMGGSGVYQMSGIDVVKEHDLDTPFGKPSAPVVECLIEGKTVYFMPRHGKGHTLLPSEVPYKANVYAMKKMGVTHFLAISAVGIMREAIKPGHMVVPDQIFDRTRGSRDSTFFGDGVVGHLPFADPFCEEMRGLILKSASEAGATVYDGGPYICMEGPLFSTRAESHFYRQTVNPSVIGMTGVTEAKLAREAELSYGMLALATDYDCWHEEEEDVNVTSVLEVLKANAEMASKITVQISQNLPASSTAESLFAAKFAIITSPEAMNPNTKEKLELLYGKYWK